MKLDANLGTEGGCLRNVGDTSRAAEALGFVGLWTSETKHYASLPLAIAASKTERIGLGTSVVIAFSRSPMEVAQTARDVQDFSGGRLLLGLGTQVWVLYHDVTFCFRATLGTDGSLVLGLVA